MRKVLTVVLTAAWLSACSNHPAAATPTPPAASPATAIASPTPTPPLASAPPAQTAPPRAAAAQLAAAPVSRRMAQVKLLGGTSPGAGYALEVVDSRGLVVNACFDFVVTTKGNPPPPLGPPFPSPTPINTQTHYSGCRDFFDLWMSERWGGTWTIRGSVRASGQVLPIAFSGQIH